MEKVLLGKPNLTAHFNYMNYLVVEMAGNFCFDIEYKSCLYFFESPGVVYFSGLQISFA